MARLAIKSNFRSDEMPNFQIKEFMGFSSFICDIELVRLLLGYKF